MAIDPKVTRVADLRGKTIGITGVPSDYASLDTALAHGRPRAQRRQGRHASATTSSRRCSRIASTPCSASTATSKGSSSQRRGLKPTIIPLDRAGVPFYDELVLVANSSRLHSDPAYADTVRRFVRAFRLGTTGARSHPARSLAILRKVTGSDAGFLARATPATLALLAGTHGVGCMRTAEWQRFGAWMHERGLLKSAVPRRSVMTTRFLPPSC